MPRATSPLSSSPCSFPTLPLCPPRCSVSFYSYFFGGGLLHQEVEFTGLEVASPTERNTLAFLGGRLLVTLISW